MSKKVTGEDGKTYVVKEKNPWYKKWWVWVIAIIVVIFLFAAFGGSGSDDSSDSSNSSSSSTKASSTKSSKSSDALKGTYKVGESATYNGYSFKVNSVKFWGGDDMDTPDSGKQYVIVNVTITNKGTEKQDYNSYDFKLNSNGDATDFDETITNDTYGKDELEDGTLDKGASVSGNLFGQAKTSNKLKLQYKPSFFDDKTIDVPLN